MSSAAGSAAPPVAPRTCAACGAQLSPRVLACPACHAFVHAETLKTLAARAERAQDDGDLRAALGAWQEAFALLPPETVQTKHIAEKIARLRREVDALPAPAATPATPATAGSGGRSKMWIALGGLALLVLGKLKWVLFGLSKWTSVLSILASAGLYWAVWGWKFAAGLIVSIYIHEMGHVAALERLGVKPTAMMFIPGIGAFVRSKSYPVTPREDARVALAGPIWGWGAAAGCFAVWKLTGHGLWAGLAEFGAVINLLNLIPLGPLDGGRGFRPLSAIARWVVVLVVGATLYVSGVTMLWLVLIGAVLGALVAAPAETDPETLLKWLVLVPALALLGALAGRPQPWVPF